MIKCSSLDHYVMLIAEGNEVPFSSVLGLQDACSVEATACVNDPLCIMTLYPL